jgi:RNA polymerase sigma-70 factor (ECF subfamily)
MILLSRKIFVRIARISYVKIKAFAIMTAKARIARIVGRRFPEGGVTEIRRTALRAHRRDATPDCLSHARRPPIECLPGLARHQAGAPGRGAAKHAPVPYRDFSILSFAGARGEQTWAVTNPAGRRHRAGRGAGTGESAPKAESAPTAESAPKAESGSPGESAPPAGPGPIGFNDADLDSLLALVARDDRVAFEAVYGRMAGPVYGLIRKVLRDPAQSEEVAQEVLLEVWRSAARFDPSRGSATTWVLTIAHRRAVDRVRSETATAERERSVPLGPGQADQVADEVADSVESSLYAEQVRRCLAGLTDLQRESITLAYYSGYTYPQVAKALKVGLATVKSRIRGGLLALRGCLGGVSW